MRWITACLLIAFALIAMGQDACSTEGGNGGKAPGDRVDNSGDQYERARQIGHDQCDPPLIDPGHAERDPVGYAEEQFGGPGEFDQSRVMGCIDALTD